MPSLTCLREHSIDHRPAPMERAVAPKPNRLRKLKPLSKSIGLHLKVKFPKEPKHRRLIVLGGWIEPAGRGLLLSAEVTKLFNEEEERYARLEQIIVNESGLPEEEAVDLTMKLFRSCFDNNRANIISDRISVIVPNLERFRQSLRH